MNGQEYQSVQYTTGSTPDPIPYLINNAQAQTAPSPMISVTMSILIIAVAMVYIVALWKIFTKASKPGWAAIIPIYNIYTLLKIVGRPGWWLLLFFIPIVNIIIHLIVAMNLAKSFKRSEAFGVVLLWLFSCVGYLILGFGKSTYAGPAVTSK